MHSIRWDLLPRLCVCLMVLSGCSTVDVRPDDLPPIPANLTQPCPLLNPLANGNADTIAKQMLEDAAMYNECASRQQALVEVVKFRETLYNLGDAK